MPDLTRPETPPIRQRLSAWAHEQRGVLLFLLAMGLMRGALADWHPIPTGSMRPTVLEGDVVLVDKRAYDWKLPFTQIALARQGEPQRGDIVVAFSPADGTRLLKRLVAIPGDTVAVVDGALWLNGQPTPLGAPQPAPDETTPWGVLPALQAQEALPAGARHWVQRLPVSSPLQHLPPQTLAPGHYFLLGDNRDNSADSRAFGAVPRSALVGRVSRLVVSVDTQRHWAPRWARWGLALD